MNIRREDFEKLLPRILRTIQSCDFLAIDLELTGLESTPEMRVSAADNFQTRYAKLKNAAESFVPTQYGVCCFTWEEKKQKLIARPMNFPLFPVPFGKPGNAGTIDRRFLCQSSSMGFVASHKFDFNMWVKEGIPYMNLDEEERAREQIRKDAERIAEPTANGGQPPSSGLVLHRQEDRDFLSETLRILKNVQEKVEKEGGNGVKKDSNNSYYHVLDLCSPWRRRIIYSEIPRLLENISVTREDSDNLDHVQHKNNQRLRIIFASTPEEKEVIEKKKREERKKKLEKELLTAVGFRKVMDEICRANKPVIGHNCATDLAHTFHSFRRTLPSDFNIYTEKLHETFEYLIDTKHMLAEANHPLTRDPVITSTTLGDAFSAVSQSPFDLEGCPIEFDSEFDRYQPEGESNTAPLAAHEAGYDAYMTGVVFARLMTAFGYHPSKIAAHITSAVNNASTAENEDLTDNMQTETVATAEEEGEIGESSKPNVPVDLRKLVNGLYMMRMGSPVRLPGPNREIDRTDFLHVSGEFTADIKTSDILQELTPFVKSPDSIAGTIWIDDSSLFLRMSSPEDVEEIIRTYALKGGEDKEQDGHDAENKGDKETLASTGKKKINIVLSTYESFLSQFGHLNFHGAASDASSAPQAKFLPAGSPRSSSQLSKEDQQRVYFSLNGEKYSSLDEALKRNASFMSDNLSATAAAETSSSKNASTLSRGKTSRPSSPRSKKLRTT